MKKGRNEVMVGMFVIIGFVLLTVTVFFVSGVYLFRPGYHVDVMYEYVSILDRGAPIRMAGVRVGEVSEVKLVFDPKIGKTRVRVKLFIEKGTEIRENYSFHIRGTHILSEPHIEIAPEPGNAPPVKPGAVIEGKNPVPLEDLIHRAHDIATQIDSILNTVETTLDDEESLEAVKNIVVNLAQLTESFNKILGGSEQELKQTITDFHHSTEALSKILVRLEAGEGTAGKLIMKDELYQELRDFIQEIKARPWRLLKRDNERSKFLGIF